MKHFISAVLISLSIFGFSNCNAQDDLKDGLYAKIITNKGSIVVKLTPEQTPLTVANFVGLAEGKIPNTAKPKGEPYFNGLKFHRVMRDFMIQTGDPSGTGAGGPGYTFKDEFVAALKHDRAGTLSMANTGYPSTNGSQFFITHKATPWLNGKHTVFGYVQEGQGTVDLIEQGDMIKSIEIIRKGEKAKNFDAAKTFEKLK